MLPLGVSLRRYVPYLPYGVFILFIKKDYKVLVAKGVVAEDILRNAEKGTPMHEVYHGQMVPSGTQIIRESEDAIAMVQNDPQLLLFSSPHNIPADLNFQSFEIKETFKTHFAWAFARDSELLEFFNYHLTRLIQLGLWRRLRKKHNEERHFIPDIEQSEAFPLGFENLLFPSLVFVTRK